VGLFEGFSRFVEHTIDADGYCGRCGCTYPYLKASTGITSSDVVLSLRDADNAPMWCNGRAVREQGLRVEECTARDPWPPVMSPIIRKGEWLRADVIVGFEEVH
jgi:hypothetical protein